MSRYGRRESITETELDLLSPFAGFGPHAPHGSEPLPPVRHTVDPLIAPNETRSKLTKKGQFWRKFHGGWRTTVALGALGSLIVLIINVCLLIWIKAKYHVPDSGAATVFEGSCPEKTKISVWCHLAINVCSTLLLSASNNAMQVLSAPTRADVDKAHARGFWMDVGIPSIKNLRIVGWRRVMLWGILALSSIPLHLFYNSVISTTLSSTDYMAILTTPEFVDGAAWNQSILAMGQYDLEGVPTQEVVPNYAMVSELQNNSVGDLRRLNNSDCVNAYYNHEFISVWRNVLLISNATNATNYVKERNGSAVLDIAADNVDVQYPPWLCSFEVGGTAVFQGSCDSGTILRGGVWALNGSYDTLSDIPRDPLQTYVQYCLAESIESHCKVTFNVFMLLVSVVCNALKTATFLFLLLLPGFKPLITVGDAIASFLTYPDPVTARVGAPTISQDGSWTPPILSKPWKPQRCHWFCGASLRQWTIGTLSILGIWVPALVLLLLFKNGSNLKYLWDEGFGAVHTNNLVKVASSEISTALLSNSPQLLLSLIYVSYNLLLTSMMMTAEYNDFAVERKTLRVSKPKGQQRSSYYLQLPYRYAVPLVICSGTLHWLVSQSFFQVKIIFFDSAGKPALHSDILACGWSPIAVTFTLGLGGIMVLVLCGLGCRKYNTGMPVMRSNSLDIAAACHPPIPNEDAALEPLSYGATDVKGYRSWYACFTNERVVPMTRKYDGTFRLDLIDDDGDELDLMVPKGAKHTRIQQNSKGGASEMIRGSV